MKKNEEYDIYEGLEYEPEWCEQCSATADEEGFDYEFNFYVIDGQAYCEHCDGLL